jgi:hypothetical protein
MFLLLVLVVTFHQIYATAIESQSRWPLRKIYLILIELVGRTSLPPAIIGFFLQTIKFGRADSRAFILVVTVLYSIIVFIRESFAVKRVWEEALRDLMEKVNKPELEEHQFSTPEALVINMKAFGILSTSRYRISKELAETGKIEFMPRKVRPQLRNIYNMDVLLGKTKRDGDIYLNTPAETFSQLRKRWSAKAHSAENDSTDIQMKVMNRSRNRSSDNEPVFNPTLSHSNSIPHDVENHAPPKSRTNSNSLGLADKTIQSNHSLEIDSDDER